MAIYRPDIKPPMWGPPDQVQYAVRANAERMGVDPSHVQAYYPLWERAGFSFLNVAGQGLLTSTNPAGAVPHGANLLADDSLVFNSPLVLGTNFTFFLTMAIAVATPSFNNPGLWRVNDTGTTFFIGEGNAFPRPAWMRVNGIDVLKNVGPTFTLDAKHCGCGFSATAGKAFVSVDSEFATGNHSVAAPSARNVPRVGWQSNSSGQLFRGVFAQFGFLSGYYPELVSQLHHTPYALLMPVARPVYFDLGGEPPGPGLRYTTPYYTSNYYTFVGDEDEGIDVALNSLLQSQTLSLVEVQRIVSLLLGDSTQGQTLSASTVDVSLPVVIASLIQSQTLSPSALTFVLSVVIDSLRQDQTLATLLLAGQTLEVSLGSLTQAQALSNAEVIRLVAAAIGSLEQGQTLTASAVSGIFGVLLHDALQGQTLASLGMGGIVDVDIDHLHHPHLLSALNVIAAQIVEIASSHQGQTLDGVDLTRMIAVGIDHSGQAQTLHGMGVGLEMILSCFDLVQGQTLDEVVLITAGKCFCITLTADKKIAVTFGDATQPGITFDAAMKPIGITFQTKTCGA